MWRLLAAPIYIWAIMQLAPIYFVIGAPVSLSRKGKFLHVIAIVAVSILLQPLNVVSGFRYSTAAEYIVFVANFYWTIYLVDRFGGRTKIYTLIDAIVEVALGVIVIGGTTLLIVF